jgi:hypothetical protein
MRVCKVSGLDRTKMFHVKHFWSNSKQFAVERPDKKIGWQASTVLGRNRLRRCVCKIRRRLIPIEGIPPCRKIIGALVLVFEIIGVLPHIDAQYYALNTLLKRGILVGRRDDIEFSVFINDEPCPS